MIALQTPSEQLEASADKSIKRTTPMTTVPSRTTGQTALVLDHHNLGGVQWVQVG